MPTGGGTKAARVPRRGPATAAFVVGSGIVTLLALHLPASTGTTTTSTAFGPRWWPTLLAAGLIAGGVAIALAARRSGTGPPVAPATAYGRRSLAAVVLLTAGFLVAWGPIDFRLAALVYAAALLTALGRRGVVPLVVIPCLLVATIHLLFDVLLGVPL